MSKLDRMTIGEIITRTGLCLTSEAIQDIWKIDAVPQRNMFNPDGASAIEKLKIKNFADELIQEGTSVELSKFLFGHESEMDKVKFVLNILRTYKQSLEKGGLSPEKEKEYRSGLAQCQNLLKDVNKTYVYYVRESESGKIESLSIINTKDEAEGKERRRKQKNVERLEVLEKEQPLSEIVAALSTIDVQFVIPYLREIGEELKFMIEYNTALDEVGGDFEVLMKMCEVTGFYNIIAGLEKSKFNAEMTRVLRTYIEEIDLDKLLLCCGIRSIEELERGKVGQENAAEIYTRLQTIQKHLKKNSKLEIPSETKESVFYDTNDLATDMKRFVVSKDGVKYFSIEKCKELRIAIIEGIISLNSLSFEEFNALYFIQSEVDELLGSYPNNYIFFLRENLLPHSKETILRNIIKARECSRELLQMLCDKTDITSEEICELFEQEIISTSDLESIKGKRQQIITDERLFQIYTEYKKSKEEDKDTAQIKFERYALAYKRLELNGKTNEELETRAQEFVVNVGADIEVTDLIHLYDLNIIPLKVAMDWDGKGIIEKMLECEKLKPADAKSLREEGLLNLETLEKLFQNMSYAYQIALLSTIFNRGTYEDKKLKKKLEQYYNIENISATNNNRASSKNERKVVDPDPIEPEEKTKPKIKMRDPGAKYEVLYELDTGVKIESGISDGHIIFHYPNIDGGTVLIEKMHKKVTNRENGTKEVRIDNESATYVISEEEFIKIRSALIRDGMVDRTQLTQRWKRKPGYWIAHTVKDGWERGIKERFKINSQNPRYSSTEELARMEELLLKSAMSREEKKEDDIEDDIEI